MLSTIERGGLLTRSPSMASPQTIKRELTPQSSISDSPLFQIQDRLNQLDSKVQDLRLNALTKDAYIDRRNRQDENIRREFNTHRTLASRIETVVGMTKTDVGQMKSELSQMRAEMLQLSTHVDRLGPNDPSNNLNRLQSDVNQLHLDVHQLYTTILATRTDLGEIQAAVGHIKTKMSHTERVRFNSLAHTVHAPITPVPVVENDGSVRWPEYFPRTIWKFWCLKRRNRIHRLVELAEFYQLEGYQYWGRMPQTHDPVFPEDGYLSDSSDSTDLPSDFTLAEATRLFPEACHQALAATLGLVYYKIRNEVGEGPNQRLIPARQKRGHDELVSLNSANPKPSKLSRRSNDLSPTNLHKIITGGPAIDANSIVSEGLDKLGWNANGSQASDEAMNKLKGMVTDEVNSILIKALERGRVKLQPSHMEIGSGSPIGSSKSGVRRQLNGAEDLAGSGDEDMHTVATEIISPISHNEDR